MKKLLRIFNIALMGLAGAAMITLFATPTLKMNIDYQVSTEQLAKSLAPSGGEGESDSQENLKKLLGDQGIGLSFNLTVKPNLLAASFGESAQDAIEKEFIAPNVTNVVEAIKVPFRVMGKAMVKMMFTSYYSTYFEGEIDKLKPSSDTRTATEIRNAGGLTDDYLNTIADDTYQLFYNTDTTVTKVSDTMFDSKNTASQKFNDANVGVTLIIAPESAKPTVRDELKKMLDGMGIIQADGESLYSVDLVADAMLVDTFRKMKNQTAEEGETTEQKAGKLNQVMTDFVKELIPASSYETVTMILKILLIVLIVFEAVWAFYFLFTLFRTIFAKQKVWTFTGPLFWIFGVIQIVLGLGLTITASILLNGNTLAKMMGGGASGEAASALANLKLSIFTSSFVPSIILLVMIPTTIIYGVFKRKYKKQLRHEVPPAVEAK